MAMTLYHGEPTGPSLTVLAALFESGLNAELRPIDLGMAERHGGTVPRAFEVDYSVEGEGPVLVVDGHALCDSVFIACYLDDAAPGCGLRPTDPYARWEMMAWCRWMIERVAPGAAALANLAWTTPRLAALDDARFDALIAPIASQDLAERWRETRSGQLSAEHRAASEARVREATQKIEGRLEARDWLMGSFSIADLESYAWVAPMRDLLSDAFADKPRLAAWLARVEARPSVQRALAQAGSPQPAHAFAPGPEINRWG
ncbi:glutathione S-transferase family protein [Sphingobium sp. B12D2B]|uniref:glutathione S-transferase family protein n=1 Tax=Sphingobium sp. B12D2B TaxID=2940577 RepID=UPI002224963A|nr:glutathione S-transferase family protein [Sphingobium sp. B12D2B]MCW2350384.1 GST-like protein [Sphingobium sp. B12D2B]